MADEHPDSLLDLGQIIHDLVRDKRLDQDAAEEALNRSRTGKSAGLHPLEYLASLELEDATKTGQKLDLATLTRWLAKTAGQPYYAIDPLKVDVAEVTPVMSQAFATRHHILAVEVSPREVTIASAEPWHTGWEDDLSHVTRKAIKRVVASPEDIRRFTTEFYRIAHSVQGAGSTEGVRSGHINSFEQLLELGDGQKTPDANDQHVVNIVDWLLQYAFEQRASDIHIEPRRDKGLLRLRIDGVLHPVYSMPASVMAAVTSRLKILGRMDVAEKRKPQDGRLKTRNPEGNEVELRLSTLPTAFGEKMVMRIFDPEVLVKSFSQLGFSAEDHNRWQAMTQKPNGIVLVTGPTGSGKTTTLYSTLKQLATSEVNVCTIEDPIEMVEPDFNQMQVQHNIDLTFASGVRALLRQDPDIIMIGEIRDLETAEMAIQAALTGHLVLSTLHTNDAPSAITRMLELGVPPYLLKAVLLGSMAQRLIRTLCPNCKKAVPADKTVWKNLTQPWSVSVPQHFYEPVGCSICRETGYQGRAGVYEIMPLSDAIRGLIGQNQDARQITHQAMKEGMHTLSLSGAQKVAAGLTSVAEILRVTPSQH
ncbi:GspE/PulE family protein [Spongorhabdus nitratireducens]